MSILDRLDALMAAGIPYETARDLMRGFEADIEAAVLRGAMAASGSCSTADAATPRQARNRRYYEKNKCLKASETDLTASETSDQDASPFLSPPPFPEPLSTTTNLSKEPPIAPQKRARKRDRGGPGHAQTAELAEKIWSLQPVLEGKRRQTKPDVHAALDAALARGGEADAILGACQAYYRLPASTKDGGEFAMGGARLLERDRWLEFVGAATAGSLALRPKFPCETIRAAVVKELGPDRGEPFAVSYLDVCAYAEEDGAKTIIAPNGFIADKLAKGAPSLERRGARITVKSTDENSRSAA